MLSDDTGKLLLRLTVALLMLFHGWNKLNGGIEWLPGLLQSNGLPGFIAPLIYVGEVLAPLFIIAGAYTRVAALIVVINMLFAVGLVHMGDVFALTGTGAWAIEAQMFYALNAVAIMLFGPGKYAAMPASKWN